MVLIDSGSFHNFLNVQVVQRGKLKLQSSTTLKVQVTNGQHLQCVGKCLDVALELPGCNPTLDFFAL